MSDRTLRRWLKDPAFCGALRNLQLDLQWETAGMVFAGARQAVAGLLQVINHGDKEHARVRAADVLLKWSCKMEDSLLFHADVRELACQVEELQARHAASGQNRTPADTPAPPAPHFAPAEDDEQEEDEQEEDEQQVREALLDQWRNPSSADPSTQSTQSTQSTPEPSTFNLQPSTFNLEPATRAPWRRSAPLNGPPPVFLTQDGQPIDPHSPLGRSLRAEYPHFDEQARRRSRVEDDDDA